MSETPTAEFIPAKLHIARAFRGLTQQELANKTALTQAFVSQIEKGHKAPSDDVLAALAHAGFATSFFLAPVDDLFPRMSATFDDARKPRHSSASD
jgi:transcriptional regulator with XRE-family HTH domain